MNRQTLEPEDRIKLETWYHLTRLLDDYHMLVFDPLYQGGLKLFAPLITRR